MTYSRTSTKGHFHNKHLSTTTISPQRQRQRQRPLKRVFNYQKASRQRPVFFSD